jgi:pimeloyl-ACP methyl ester carboxylesterase
MSAPPVVLVHSMSGPYGFRLAELCGNTLRALVTIAPGPRGPGAPGDIQPEPRVISESAEAVTVAQPATQTTPAGSTTRRCPCPRAPGTACYEQRRRRPLLGG